MSSGPARLSGSGRQVRQHCHGRQRGYARWMVRPPGFRTLSGWHRVCFMAGGVVGSRAREMIGQRLVLFALSAWVPLLASTHCSSSDRGAAGTGGSGGSAATGSDGQVLNMSGAAGQANQPAGGLNPLCGGYFERDCNPDGGDDMESCVGVELPQTGTGGTGGSPGSGGSGTGGSYNQGGESGMAGEGGAAGEGGDNGIPVEDGPDLDIGGDEGQPGATNVACRVQASNGDPVRACARAGLGDNGKPCTSAADCAPEFGCVGEGEAGVCRHYCCAGAERSCAAGLHCGERKLFGTEVPIPVCVRADNCNLAEPYPCPPGAGCQCGDGTACMVVRRDGTTTCVAPGPGLTGDECPCGWGHVCSQASGTCLRLCETVSDRDQCDGGVCQAAANLPGDWGVCIDTGAN